MPKHTPAPWKLANSGYANAPSVVYVGEKSPDFGARYPLQGCDWIAEVREDESTRGREFHANSRLISAAPEMADLLLSAYLHVSHGGPTRAEVEIVLKKAGLL